MHLVCVSCFDQYIWRSYSLARNLFVNMADTPSPDDVITTCVLCQEYLYEPQILPCLHVLCINCVQQHNVRSKPQFICPVCEFATPSDKGTPPYRSCNFAKLHLKQRSEKERNSYGKERDSNGKGPESNEKILENNGRHFVSENDNKESVRSDIIHEIGHNDDDVLDDDDDVVCFSNQDDDAADDEEEIVESKNSTVCRLVCTSHQQHEADMFCRACHVPMCDKCLKTLHRRCKGHSSLNDAVEDKRPELDKIHASMSVLSLNLQNQLKTKKQQMLEIEQEKEDVVKKIASFRQEVVNAVYAQERMLLDELEDMYGKEVVKVKEEMERDAHGLSCLSHSIDVFECALSFGAEGEILQDLPLIEKRVDLYEKELTKDTTVSNRIHTTFDPNNKLLDTLSTLGEVSVFRGERSPSVNICAKETIPNENEWGCSFRLMISYHGSTRDDTTHPLLTDAVLLANGDVILTDRDNRSLKKFNADGKLLTRVEIPEVPSRLAIVSGSKIVVSVMNKKVLLFLSLHGTLRVLTKCRIAKQYSFVTSTTDGLLVVSTNNCDSIDIISQKGEFLRTLYTQKSEKAVLSRPIYLHSTHDGTMLISDSSRKCLLAVTSQGENLFKYKASENNPMECPLGVTCDPNGYTLLADRDTNTVHLLSPSGDFLKVLLNEDLPVEKPCAINFYKGEALVVTQVDGTVKVFSCVRNE